MCPRQLRDLVPPQSANSAAQDGTDSKRPKHVVLSDAIQLIRDLQQKVLAAHAISCCKCTQGLYVFSVTRASPGEQATFTDSPSALDEGQEAADLFHRSYHDSLGRRCVHATTGCTVLAGSMVQDFELACLGCNIGKAELVLLQ